MVDRGSGTAFDKWTLEYANDPEYVAEGLAIKVTEEMLECLELKGVSQSWLADQMGVSRAHISRILNARPNMTLLTIAKIAVALGVKPDVCLDSEPWSLDRINPVGAEQLIGPVRVLCAAGDSESCLPTLQVGASCLQSVPNTATQIGGG